jgi:hypothetical protein
MAETTQQYVQRILGTLGTEDPVEVLARGPEQLKHALARFSAETSRST